MPNTHVAEVHKERYVTHIKLQDQEGVEHRISRMASEPRCGSVPEWRIPHILTRTLSDP